MGVTIRTSIGMACQLRRLRPVLDQAETCPKALHLRQYGKRAETTASRLQIFENRLSCNSSTALFTEICQSLSRLRLFVQKNSPFRQQPIRYFFCVANGFRGIFDQLLALLHLSLQFRDLAEQHFTSVCKFASPLEPFR